MARYQRLKNYRCGEKRHGCAEIDLLEAPNLPLSMGFGINSIARRSLFPVSRWFERLTITELIAFRNAKRIGGEVRSMLAVVRDRPRLKPFSSLKEIKRGGRSPAVANWAVLGSGAKLKRCAPRPGLPFFLQSLGVQMPLTLHWRILN
jgi:hypothetical protein